MRVRLEHLRGFLEAVDVLKRARMEDDRAARAQHDNLPAHVGGPRNLGHQQPLGRRDDAGEGTKDVVEPFPPFDAPSLGGMAGGMGFSQGRGGGAERTQSDPFAAANLRQTNERQRERDARSEDEMSEDEMWEDEISEDEMSVAQLAEDDRSRKWLAGDSDVAESSTRKPYPRKMSEARMAERERVRKRREKRQLQQNRAQNKRKQEDQAESMASPPKQQRLEQEAEQKKPDEEAAERPAAERESG